MYYDMIRRNRFTVRLVRCCGAELAFTIKQRDRLEKCKRIKLRINKCELFDAAVTTTSGYTARARRRGACYRRVDQRQRYCFTVRRGTSTLGLLCVLEKI